MTTPSHYEVLGVDPGADRDTIRRAYIVVAKQVHPDRTATESALRIEAAETIRRANEAWTVLSDPDRRADYDRRTRGPVRAAASVDSVDRPSTVTSGVLVPSRTAPLWKWGPVVGLVVLLLGILVFSAYATSHEPVESSPPATAAASLEVGQCVFVVFTDSGRAATPTPCTAQTSGRIDSIVETPRPCRPDTESVQLFDGRTTLCLVPGG
jgi:hypothetical protein